jgi:hypothetical protein
VKDFGHTVMQSHIELVSAVITDHYNCNGHLHEGAGVVMLVEAGRTTEWWMNIHTLKLCFWSNFTDMTIYFEIVAGRMRIPDAAY